MFAVKIIDKKALKGKEDSLENEIKVLRRYNWFIYNMEWFIQLGFKVVTVTMIKAATQQIKAIFVWRYRAMLSELV